MKTDNSAVTRVITDNCLKPGDTMKTVAGIDVDDSVVLGPNSCLYLQDGVYHLLGDRPISGEGYDISLTPAAMEAIRGTSF